MEQENLELNNEIKKEEVKSKISMPVAIVFSALILASAIFITRSSGENVTENNNSKLSIIAGVTEKDFIRGDENALITIIEYADFSCGFCGVYHPTLQKIVKEYEGNVRWIYRHLPIFNIDAAVASQCVGNIAGSEKFWNFTDTLFLNKDKYSKDFYKQTAIELGVLESEYNSCVDGQIVRSEIQRDFTRAKLLLGLNATPHTIVFDQKGREFSFAGALPYEDVKFLIDGLLK